MEMLKKEDQAKLDALSKQLADEKKVRAARPRGFHRSPARDAAARGSRVLGDRPRTEGRADRLALRRHTAVVPAHRGGRGGGLRAANQGRGAVDVRARNVEALIKHGTPASPAEHGREPLPLRAAQWP